MSIKSNFDISDLTDIYLLVAEQCEDEGLWFVAETSSEAYLQDALRKLHELIEKALGET